MSDEIEQEKHTPQHIAVSVAWHVSEQISSRYADNVVVQAKKHDATISFFEVQIPPFVGTPDETREFLEKLGTVRAECVGRIVVSVDLLPEIIKALQTTYDGHLAFKEN